MRHNLRKKQLNAQNMTHWAGGSTLDKEKHMKRIIIAAVFGIFTTGSAFAIENGDAFSSGDSNGPRADVTSGYGTRYLAARAVRKAPAATINPWSHDYAPYGQAGSMPAAGLQGAFVPSLTPDEMAAQQRANREWIARQNAEYHGWDDGFLPVRVYTNRNRPGSLGTAFGEGPQMGSNGGSD